MSGAVTTALVLHPMRARRLASCLKARASFRRLKARTCRRGHRWTAANTMPVLAGEQARPGRRRCRACWLIACARSVRRRAALEKLKAAHPDRGGDAAEFRKALKDYRREVAAA